MPRAPGRDSVAPLERLVRLLSVLWSAGRDGVSGARLLRVAAFGGDEEGQRTQLVRTFRQLNALGYDIRNVADEGAPAVYVLVARDNRLRVSLTPAQQAELRRAARVAGRPEVAGSIDDDGAPEADDPAVRVTPRGRPADLDKVLHAAARRCLLHFTYKERERTVHPRAVHAGVSGWYVAGREDSGTVVKSFVVDRMRDVRLDPPGTAERPPSPHRAALDPLSWLVDPPVDVVVETTRDHEPQVRELLGAPARTSPPDGDVVRVTVPVTHRAAFRARLYELGPRVRLVGPADVRAEVLGELAHAAGVPA